LFTFRFPKYPFLIRLPYLTLAPRSPFKFCYLQFYFSLIISFLFSKFSQVLNRGSRVGGCGPFLLFFSVVSLPLLLFHLALQPESAISYLAGEDPIDFYSRHFWEHPITEISQILLSSNIVSRGSGNLSMMLLSNDRSFVFRSMTAHFCSRTRNYNFHFFFKPANQCSFEQNLRCRIHSNLFALKTCRTVRVLPPTFQQESAFFL
jgi:hypothetical protein